MKKQLIKVAIYATVALFGSLVTSNYVNAEENETNYEITVEDSIFQEGDICLLDEKAVVSQSQDKEAEKADFINEDELNADIQEDIVEDAPTPDTMYSGKISDYLNQTNDYLLYPAQLNRGEYLQARLTPPNDSNLDYDLWILDKDFKTIVVSEYVTVTSSSRSTLEESLGYKASTDELVYVCVYSSAGGSATLPFLLEYSVSTNAFDGDEPDENARDAKSLDISGAGATVSKWLNSPLDNDWYKFTVLDDCKYDKIRFSVESNSSVNRCRFEIYQNIVSDNNLWGMAYLGEGTEGETPLAPGTYYLRVVSSNGLDSFDPLSIPNYTLSVVPVSKVDYIEITDLTGFHGGQCSYPEGPYYRMEENLLFPNQIGVYGRCWYYDENGVPRRAANIKLKTQVFDYQWDERGEKDKAYTNGEAITNANGFFYATAYFPRVAGGLHYQNVVMHRYDLLRVIVRLESNEKVNAYRDFYCDRDSQ